MTKRKRSQFRAASKIPVATIRFNSLEVGDKLVLFGEYGSKSLCEVIELHDGYGRIDFGYLAFLSTGKLANDDLTTRIGSEYVTHLTPELKREIDEMATINRISAFMREPMRVATLSLADRNKILEFIERRDKGRCR